jgi:hypothetical protein
MTGAFVGARVRLRKLPNGEQGRIMRLFAAAGGLMASVRWDEGSWSKVLVSELAPAFRRPPKGAPPSAA